MEAADKDGKGGSVNGSTTSLGGRSKGADPDTDTGRGPQRSAGRQADDSASLGSASKSRPRSRESQDGCADDNFSATSASNARRESRDSLGGKSQNSQGSTSRAMNGSLENNQDRPSSRNSVQSTSGAKGGSLASLRERPPSSNSIKSNPDSRSKDGGDDDNGDVMLVATIDNDDDNKTDDTANDNDMQDADSGGADFDIEAGTSLQSGDDDNQSISSSRRRERSRVSDEGKGESLGRSSAQSRTSSKQTKRHSLASNRSLRADADLEDSAEEPMDGNQDTEERFPDATSSAKLENEVGGTLDPTSDENFEFKSDEAVIETWDKQDPETDDWAMETDQNERVTEASPVSRASKRSEDRFEDRYVDPENAEMKTGGDERFIDEDSADRYEEATGERAESPLKVINVRPWKSMANFEEPEEEEEEAPQKQWKYKLAAELQSAAADDTPPQEDDAATEQDGMSESDEPNNVNGDEDIDTKSTSRDVIIEITEDADHQEDSGYAGDDDKTAYGGSRPTSQQTRFKGRKSNRIEPERDGSAGSRGEVDARRRDQLPWTIDPAAGRSAVTATAITEAGGDGDESYSGQPVAASSSPAGTVHLTVPDPFSDAFFLDPLPRAQSVPGDSGMSGESSGGDVGPGEANKEEGDAPKPSREDSGSQGDVNGVVETLPGEVLVADMPDPQVTPVDKDATSPSVKSMDSGNGTDVAMETGDTEIGTVDSDEMSQKQVDVDDNDDKKASFRIGDDDQAGGAEAEDENNQNGGSRYEDLGENADEKTEMLPNEEGSNRGSLGNVKEAKKKKFHSKVPLVANGPPMKSTSSGNIKGKLSGQTRVSSNNSLNSLPSNGKDSTSKRVAKTTPKIRPKKDSNTRGKLFSAKVEADPKKKGDESRKGSAKNHDETASTGSTTSLLTPDSDKQSTPRSGRPHGKGKVQSLKNTLLSKSVEKALTTGDMGKGDRPASDKDITRSKTQEKPMGSATPPSAHTNKVAFTNGILASTKTPKGDAAPAAADNTPKSILTRAAWKKVGVKPPGGPQALGRAPSPLKAKSPSKVSLVVPNSPREASTLGVTEEGGEEAWARRESTRLSLDDSMSRKSVDFRVVKPLATTVVAMPVEKPKMHSVIGSETDIQAAIPYLPMPMAVLCLILNIVLPGFGTILAGLAVICCGRSRASSRNTLGETVCLNLWVGVSQFFTIMFLLVGWVWSIIWGIRMISLSLEYREEQRILREKELQSLALSAFGSPGHTRSFLPMKPKT